ncbi:MAG: GNAT family N-acetyltransferase [Candidatus Hydrogenedentes bacterium]|nr:GNAT family N-acetyltransferase [Candidatus Hydrogenedentota bacterium]
MHKTSPANFGVLAAMAPAGFDLLCCHLDYLADADRAAQLSKPIEGYEFGPARSDEEEQVARLTQDNYALMDRFNIDPLVPRDRVRSVYYEWGRNAFHGYSDLVWVARHEGNVVGISFWSDRAHLETLTSVKCALNQLGAVDRRHAGRGIFRRIQSTVLAHYRQRGVRWATMATNALNHPTQRSFQSIGAVIFDSTFTFRKDLQRP